MKVPALESDRAPAAGDHSDSLNPTRDAHEPPIDQATEVVADTSLPEHRLPGTTTAAEPGPCLVHGLWTDRRAYRRFAARELVGLRSARIKLGPPVSLVNLSAGGALFETEARLRPESEAVLELAGVLRRIIVPFRVLRCQVSALNGSLRYRGGCDFARELDLADLVLPSAVAVVADTPIDPPERIDLALKTILEPYLRPADGGVVTPQSLSRRQVAELVKSLQTVSHRRSVDPMAWAIHDVLALVTSALQFDEGSAGWTSVEGHLRNVLRGLTAGSADAPACAPPLDTEALYFQVPPPCGDARRVLNVAIPQGGMFEGWQFHLPKESTWLAALPGTTREEGTGGPGGRAERRHHVRVTGPFDGRRHGAIDTPLLIHNLSEGGCFVDSLFQAEAGRQLILGVSVPDEGWITLNAEVVRGQPGFGFAVRFVEMPDATRACLARMVARRTASVAPDVATEQMTACNAW